LLTQTGITTVPQIFINGRFVGGNDTIHRLHLERSLVQLILQPMKPIPSINTAGTGSSQTTSKRISGFQKRTASAPAALDKFMPVNRTIPMLSGNNSEIFTTGFRSKGKRSSLTKMDSYSRIFPSYKETKVIRSRRRGTSLPNITTLKSSSSMNHLNVSTADLEILSRPARRLSASNFDSTSQVLLGFKHDSLTRGNQYIGREQGRFLYPPAKVGRGMSNRERPLLEILSHKNRRYMSTVNNDSQEIPARFQVSQLL